MVRDTIAKRRGIRKPWLSWVPVGNMWILGSISDQYQYVVKGKVRNKRKVLLTLNILLYVMAFSLIAWIVHFVFSVMGYPLQDALTSGSFFGGFLGTVLVYFLSAGISIALTVITYIALYDLYRSCEPDNSILYLLLSIFVNIAQPIIIFICRNKELGMPPRKQEPSAFIPPDPVEIPPWRPAQNTEDPWNNPEE